MVPIVLLNQAFQVNQVVLFLQEIQVTQGFLLFLSVLVGQVDQEALLYQLLRVCQHHLEHPEDQENHSRQ